MYKTKQEVLKDCTLENNVVKLPDVQLDRKIYTEVAKALEGIGGKWNRKAGGFTFTPGHENQIDTLLGRVQAGEKVNLKKDFQFFPTPEDIGEWVVSLADVQPGHRVLEPSAGQGALVDQILKAHSNISIHMCELMPSNVEVLKQKYEGNRWIMPIHKPHDFLKVDIFYEFDRIIANPPFTKNQDIDHITHMYRMLKDGGRLVSVASKHWQTAGERKCRDFREWLDQVGAEVHEIERGRFKESGTMIATCVIVINK